MAAALSHVVGAAIRGFEAVREYVEEAERAGGADRATFDGATAAALVGGIECVGCVFDCDDCGPGGQCDCGERCIFCEEDHKEARAWLIERLVAPCALTQLRNILSDRRDGSLNIAKYFRRAPREAAIAYGALAGEDRDKFAAELRKVTVPTTRAIYDRMKRDARRKVLRKRLTVNPPHMRLSALGILSPAAARSADRRDGGAARRALKTSRWLERMEGYSVDYPDEYDPRYDEVTRLDPLWPPAKIHARMALVSAGRREYARRRLRTLALNLAAIVRGRAAASSAAALLGARAASALAYGARRGDF